MAYSSSTYELRLFDKTLLTFDFARSKFGDLKAEIVSVEEGVQALLPLSLVDRLDDDLLLEWLMRRRIPKNRAYVDEVLRSCGIESDDLEEIIKVGKGLSLNDSYWIVPAGFEGRFSQFNLYENELNAALQLAAYAGVVSDATGAAGMPSELTNSGMFPKAWRVVNGRRVLCKAGHLFCGANVGKEPYSEHLASQLARRMGLNAVSYDLDIWNDRLCSTCELFSSADVAFVPLGHAMSAEKFRKMGLREALAFYARLGEGSLEDFKSMLVFDALAFNEGRHMGNYGVMRDSVTGAVLSMAPVFSTLMSPGASTSFCLLRPSTPSNCWKR